MQQSGGPPKPSSYAPLLSIIPAAVLYLMSRAAFQIYSENSYTIRYYGRNIYEPLLIGGVIWAVAAGALAAMLFIEAILRMYGKGYDLPSVTVALAGAWNLLLGLFAFAAQPFGCGLSGHITPEMRLPDALYLTAITFGLLLAGIGAIKYRSFKGPSGTAARVMCYVNGILAVLGALYVFTNGCIYAGLV